MSAMASHVFALLMVLLLLLNGSWGISTTGGFRVSLTRIQPEGNLTKLQFHQRAVKQSRQHLAAALTAGKLSSSASKTGGIRAPVHYKDFKYEMELAIGTPPVPFRAVISSAFDFTWTQCQPCTQCQRQAGPIYDPSKSSTFSKAPRNSSLCQAWRGGEAGSSDCVASYIFDYSPIDGVVATETFTFENTDGQQVSFPGIGFGCIHSNHANNDTGGVGLDREPFSLISQLGLGKFSLCLTPFDDEKSSLLFLGSSASLNNSSSIPLLHTSLPLYSLALKGITVGSTRLPIPEETFDVNADGFGGLYIDIDFPYGALVDIAFELVKKELTASLKLSVVDPLITRSELCYLLPSNSSVEVPKLIFHFEGADLELPVHNYMIHDPDTGFLCFTMSKSFSSYFGSFQLQNMNIVFDLVGEKASIDVAQCDRL